MEQVVVEKPDIQGRGSIRYISMNGLDVTSHDAISTVGRFIYSLEDLKQVLRIVDSVLPCLGYARQHMEYERRLPTGSAEAWGSVVRGAERALLGDHVPVMGERWRNAPVRGVLKGSGGVSGVLGTVGHTVDVLWSKDCTGVASDYASGGQRCSRCKKFWRDTAKPRITTLTGEPKPNTANYRLSSGQKTTKLSQLATSMKAANEPAERWHRKVKQYREECIEFPKDQGDAVHKFLIDQETRELLDKKLPPKSEQRALLNDLIQGNLSKGDGRGYRFHLSTMKFCIYYSGVAGTGAYNALRSVVHLPSQWVEVPHLDVVYQHTARRGSRLCTQVPDVRKAGQVEPIASPVALGQVALYEILGQRNSVSFPVAFPHPVHLGPIFNMSDPPHILKKIANTCWHSDQDSKKRELAMWCGDEEGNTDLVRFSLATAERVYNQVENDGNTLSQEEKVASITTFRKVVPSCFNRNSWNCMNVSYSAKVLSGTIVCMIEKVQRDLLTMGKPLDLELDCYAALAAKMDAFIDIFNGKLYIIFVLAYCLVFLKQQMWWSGNFGRSEYARRNGLDKEAGYISSADDSKLEELINMVRFFDKWRSSLQEKTTMGDETWKKHFITEFSWTDIRVCILGFVSMCRYLFEEDSRFKVSPRRPWPHFINQRNCGQDVIEHCFGHMRQGLGSHRNPTAAQAKERGARGDILRGLHGPCRANYNRNARKGRDFVASGYRAEVMLPVGEGERSVRIRARTKDSDEAVLSPWYISVAAPGATPVADGSAVESGAPQDSASRESA
ncbi:unnamed protein product [Ectocarpus sp. CCAP 1310/34]|nr:unnamed protein product [Ectocarpus sp. CCAP 1310/34]